MISYIKSIKGMSDSELVQVFAIVEGKRRIYGEKGNWLLVMALKRELKKRKLMIRIY